MYHNRNTKSGQRGFTLLEILLALAVVAVLSFVVFRAFNSANGSAQVNSAVSDVGTIQANLKNTFPNSNYKGLLTTVANQAHVFPNDMNANNFTATYTNITNQWNGSVSLVATGSRANEYTLSYNGVPAAVCAQFVGQVAQNAINVTVGATTASSTTVFSGGVVSPSAVATQCATASTSANNPVSVNIIGN